MTVTLYLILILKSSKLNTSKINDSALHTCVIINSCQLLVFNINIIKLILFILSFAIFLLQCQHDGCHQSFKKSSQLTRHNCVHTNEKRFKYVKTDEQCYGI